MNRWTNVVCQHIDWYGKLVCKRVATEWDYTSEVPLCQEHMLYWAYQDFLSSRWD